jgi:ABC-type transport system substrate-binding protein
MRRRGDMLLGCILAVTVWWWTCLTTNLWAAEAPPYKPEREMRWAMYVTLSPSWFDPGDVVGLLTPFWVLYAMHDAVVKPMPGNLMTPSLAESWTVSADQQCTSLHCGRACDFITAILLPLHQAATPDPCLMPSGSGGLP